MYRARILSRHPSHNILRREMPKVNYPNVIRFGSFTKNKSKCVEINTVESIEISSDKKLMKQKFDEAGVKTAPWTFGDNIESIISNIASKEIEYPIVAKSRLGSRGIGNTKIDDEHHLRNWMQGKDLTRYIFEKFLNYSLEFRLHITKNGCFYTCRKALKKDAPEESRWRRHHDNSVWLLDTNEQFRKPNSWKQIEEDCIKALIAVGADVLSFDVRVQGEMTAKGTKRKSQDYILIESNSASSMNSDGEISICASKYLEILPQLINEKGENK